MLFSLLAYLAPWLLLGTIAALVIHYWGRFSVEAGDEFGRVWFWRWVRRGVAVPVMVWVFLNIGKSPLMPPLSHSVEHLRIFGKWNTALYYQTLLAGLTIVFWWSTLTYGWFLASLWKRARNNDDLVIAAVVWSPAMLPLYLVFGYLFGWTAGGVPAFFWILPLAQYSLYKADLRKPSPTYSRAIAKVKFGKYREAEMAIISQLEKCESDFDGWMMLADLYAVQFKDLSEAEKTILSLCGDLAITPSQVSVALHRLADWHLQLNGDPVKARDVLELIGERMPETHLALMARHRINQLPVSRAEMAEAQKTKTFHLPVPNEKLLEAAESSAHLNSEQASSLANQLVEKLKTDPNDVDAREQLATVFAEEMGHINLAIEQLELLVGMTDQSPEKAVELLGRIVAWRTKYQGGSEAARETMQRLVRDYPRSPQAFAAQKELILMDMNAKIRRAGNNMLKEPKSEDSA